MQLEIAITDEESAELKARILKNVETRVTDSLVEEIRRSIGSETTRKLYRDARASLVERMKETLTDERILGILDKVITEFENEGRSWRQGRSVLGDLLRDAIMRVTTHYQLSIENEMKNLLSHALQEHFFAKKAEP